MIRLKAIAFTVFLAAGPAGAGSYTVLHQFTGLTDGAIPSAALVADKAGNLFGTAYRGGDPNLQEGDGSVFKSDLNGNITPLHLFSGADGDQPSSNPLTLIDQTLYGGTRFGGQELGGVLFSMNTDGSAYTLIHNFLGKEGYNPIGPLQPVPGHGFVGVTETGGPAWQSPFHSLGWGVLFGLSRHGDYKVLHHFDQADGQNPNFVLVDGVGGVYGSTGQGGGYCAVQHRGCGVIFKYDFNTNVYTILYSFTGAADGYYPVLGSIGPDGTLYGATELGKGVSRNGALFKLTPSVSGYQFTTLAYSSNALGGLTAGPTLTPSGALIGSAQYGLYVYESAGHGILQALNTAATGSDPSQPITAPGHQILGTTAAGGIVPCIAADGTSISNAGCGVLYRYVTR